ncbi:Hsp20/alpha crystallin family protein [Tenacibaculum larymnensis]|uniref:Hsp20/alpha crystallin family protein n=1 Tax=Tenacibaculum larymnensis TaxID=2878201 RepID=A0A9X4IQK0_9FLAO|nr:Hsp20/alpha crystallin family protein [Tenacibaculum larymnensis]MDE1207925.1 Hsp20/alpha crystallin family protein [Tenacibaculum larymnensis]
MSLIKFNEKRRGLPLWTNGGLRNFLDIDDFFNTNFFEEDSLMPAMNVKEQDDNFEIEFAAPGFSKKDFEITIDNNVLNVCGEKKHEVEEKEEDFTRKEFSYNSFKRSLSLPESINTDQDIKASYENGILKLNLHKKEGTKQKPKKIIEIQ